ncbi:hypothetical protein BT96DRAFT_929778 [Gymnopus androsaceus JB14]|uniref:Uncharacterized protein n=1 Tax=Gymnopus androsaceus JB14 TaxID=1447944 RepID=A0A6A4GDA1_9AGAR|nr:hypothetical protein BT96DRAFT_929778 [Gymnopus androsaceus JB14]
MLCAYSSPPEKTLALSRTLLDRGADPNRLWPVHLAGVVFKRIASQVRDDLLQLPLERGADPRLSKSNAIECTLMFVKNYVGW